MYIHSIYDTIQSNLAHGEIEKQVTYYQGKQQLMETDLKKWISDLTEKVFTIAIIIIASGK
jgi:hypothetical protein